MTGLLDRGHRVHMWARAHWMAVLLVLVVAVLADLVATLLTAVLIAAWCAS